ncbi:MAG TPA: hypothetical protein V6D11_19780 [Waterburya sp.]
MKYYSVFRLVLRSLGTMCIKPNFDDLRHHALKFLDRRLNQDR